MGASPLIPQHGPGFAQAVTEQEAARQAREAMIEVLTVSFDKAVAYVNVIILAGYAGSFTSWAYTRDQLSPNATILVALLLGVSLAFFVFFEVFKMLFIHRHNTKQAKLLHADHEARVFLERLRTLQSAAPQSTLWFMRIWGAVTAVSVISGLCAVGILFYNFFALLFGSPLWPGC
jgi:hypothetical protein